jgi:hypothetical protein
MFLTFCKRLCGFSLLLILVACSAPTQPDGKLGEKSRDDFMSAMRWKRFQIAASLMLPEHRQEFMATFTPLKDIHITDVRLIDLKESEAGQRFETSIEMDYYLLPSVTVKTFHFGQSWKYFAGDDPTLQGFYIITSFPDFP